MKARRPRLNPPRPARRAPRYPRTWVSTSARGVRPTLRKDSMVADSRAAAVTHHHVRVVPQGAGTGPRGQGGRAACGLLQPAELVVGGACALAGDASGAPKWRPGRARGAERRALEGLDQALQRLTGATLLDSVVTIPATSKRVSASNSAYSSESRHPDLGITPMPRHVAHANTSSTTAWATGFPAEATARG